MRLQNAYSTFFLTYENSFDLNRKNARQLFSNSHKFRNKTLFDVWENFVDFEAFNSTYVACTNIFLFIK